MATTPQAPPSQAPVSQAPASQRTIHTAQLITAMLKSNSHVSDLIFSPGRAPQIEVSGELVELKFKGLESLSPDDTRFIAYDIIGKNDHPIRKLEQDGSADLSYGLPGIARFRVNIFHILTIEDPIEFLHRHKKSTIHQRELHSDTPTFALALRAALRQAPKVILVGEMRDRETIEIALEAAETGHLVLSTLHTIDASKTVERIIGVFPQSDQQGIRTRFGKAFRYIVSQRLLPKKDGKGRIAAIEILKATMRTREYVEKGEGEGKTLLDAMRDGDTEGMQHFDGVIEKFIRNGTIDFETGMAFSTNPGNMRLELADFIDNPRAAKAAAPRPRESQATELEVEP
jgi:Tfp pilus assembly pilus retraction ATPase PilT